MSRQPTPHRDCRTPRIFGSAVFMAALLLLLMLAVSLQGSSTATAASVVGPGVYQENNSSLAYYGYWTYVVDSQANGGAFQVTGTPGASVSLTITGARSISWTTPGDPAGGIGRVLIDNVVVATVDLYRLTRTYGLTFGPYLLSSSGTHTFQIVNTGNKNFKSSGYYVGLDQLTVVGAPTSTPTRVLPTSTPTSTRTSTPTRVPPTNTPTSTPTSTPTRVPPTNTPTLVPPSSTSTHVPPTSTPTSVPTQGAPGGGVGPGIYQEMSNGISYVGVWSLVYDSAASGSWFDCSNSSGASVSIVVTGASSINWSSPGDPAGGIVQAMVDGTVVDTVDLYRPQRTYGIVFGPYAVSPGSPHTFTLVNTGSKNTSSSDTYAGLDYIQVNGVTPATVTAVPTNTPLPTNTLPPTSTPLPTNTPPSTNTPLPPTATPVPASGHLRRVNAPYFSGSTVPYEQTGIFWLGQTTSNTQYGDIRIGYSDTELFVNANVMDRFLWYNENPSPSNLTAYDSVSLFMSKSGTSTGAPDNNAYRFDAQFNWWESDRSKWQAAYQGNGSSWALVSSPFTTQSNWRGNRPNDSGEDGGFYLTFHIPYAALGLSGPPPQGTVWGLGVALHNRNDAAGTFIRDQVWPENMSGASPTTWGQLRFGVPAFTPSPAHNLQTVSIKQNLNGQAVTTTNVGGYTLCGENLFSAGYTGASYWDAWGTQNWAGKEYLNVMNQNDPADWACYNKVYANFPLGLVPSGKVITSAKLTVLQFGHAGEGSQNPGPSLFQVLSTDTSWNPSTINWNNAPWPNENGDRQWAGTGGCFNYVNCPSVMFDVSQMVANAYAAKQPLRVILYDTDSQISSGKYLFSSETGDWNTANRPVLQVTYGDR